ncbi:YadA-like family protein [Veillonella caviae]|uniref:YadA-like family protein n=1 Tax=Veillonella caviae TaxID=248316 RepID=UPI002A916097|nr:YadA-like family protein [Veillonella caviae]
MHIANTVSGVANRTNNSNGSLIYGAGNEIINSHTSLTNVPSSATGMVPEFAEQLRNSVRASNSGGATMILGGGNKADTTQHVSLIGVNNTAKNTENSLVMGDNHTVNDSEHAIIIGTANANKNMTTTASNIVAIGHNSDAQKDYAIAIGENAVVSESGTLAIGSNAAASVDNGIALGTYSKATVAAGAVGYDITTKSASTNTTSTWKSTAAAVSVGDVDNGLTRQITSVAAGTNDTDAVNVAQLKTVQQQLETNTNDITNLSNQVSNHTTIINEHTQQIADNSQQITNNTNNITDNRRLIDANTTKIDNNTNNIADNRRLIDTNTTAIKSINSNVRQLDNRMNRAVAGAAALAALHPLDFDENAKWDIAAGYGHYKNGNAAALGAFYRPNEDIQLNIRSTIGNGENILNAGISVKIGAHDTASVFRKTLTKQVEDLQHTVQTQQQEIEELKDMIRSMR